MQTWTPSQALTAMRRPAPLQSVDAKRSESVRFGYCIGTLNFLIPEGVLSEVLRAPPIFPIPNVPVALRGYINRQGALIPVWDLASTIDCRNVDELLAQPSTSVFRKDEAESVLVLGRDDNRVGVMIDGLPRAIRSIEKSTRLPLLPSQLIGHVSVALFADGLLWLELNHVTLFQSLAIEQAA
jgi:chemotaxis signal transduction protein